MNNEALIATKTGNLDKLKELLDHDININAQDASGRTLLHHAVSNDQREVVGYLLKNGADVLVNTNKNNTALHIAISKRDNDVGKDSVVYDLLENVARNKLRQLLDRKTKATGTTALHVAAKKSYFDNVLILLDYGANFEITNDNGEKPVDVANTDKLQLLFTFIGESFVKAKNGDEELIADLGKVHHLLFHSALRCRNNEGHTIMQVLIANNHEKLARELTMLRLYKPTEDRECEWIYSRDRISEIEKLAEQCKIYQKFWSEQSEAIQVLVNSVQGIREGKRKPSAVEVCNSVSNKILLICCRVVEEAHEVFLAYRRFAGEKSLTANQMMKTLEDILEILGFDPDQLAHETCYYQKLHVIWKTNLLPFIYILESIIQLSIDTLSQHLKSNQLRHAVIDGNVEKVQQLLGNTQFYEHLDHNNRTVMSYAAETGNKKIIRLLLKAGVPVIQIYKTEYTIVHQSNLVTTVLSPVYLAAKNGHAKVVKLLLKNVDPKDMAEFIDCQNVVKRTALHAAAKKGHLDIVKTLLSYGASYRILDGKNRTPLDVSTNEDVSAFLKIVDECFHDAKEANIELVQKLKAMQTDELMAVVSTRNCKGHTLAVVAAKANAKHIAIIILRMIKEVKQDKD